MRAFLGVLPLVLVACTATGDLPTSESADPTVDLQGGAPDVDTERPGGDDTDVLPDTDDTDDTDDSDVPVVPACTLGVGETSMTPVTAGAEIPVWLGSQGRWHVFGAVTCVGITGGGRSGSYARDDLANPSNPLVTWRIEDSTGYRMAGYDALRRPMTTDDGVGIVGELLVFWVGTYVDTVNQDATMVFHLEDVGGAILDQSIPIRLVPYPGWIPPEPVDTGDTDTAAPPP